MPQPRIPPMTIIAYVIIGVLLMRSTMVAMWKSSSSSSMTDSTFSSTTIKKSYLTAWEKQTRLAKYGYVPGNEDLVLVLGSGGVLGRALVQELHAQRYRVMVVDSRQHLDLREPGAMSVFDAVASEIECVYFLACEVGGSKFLLSDSVQRSIWASNEAMSTEVIGWLQTHPAIKVIFTSSQLSDQASVYGRVKARAEHLIKQLPRGKSLWFWNVVSGEPLGIRSHVASDWAYLCVTKGVVKTSSNGMEERQFIHSKEAAQGMILMLQHFESLGDAITPITNGKWSTLRDLAAAFDRVVPGGCKVSFDSSKPIVYQRLTGATRKEPDMSAVIFRYWTPNMTLDEIARLTSEYYVTQQQQQQAQRMGGARETPYIVVALHGRNDDDVKNWLQRWSKSIATLVVQPPSLQVWVVDTVMFPLSKEFKNELQSSTANSIHVVRARSSQTLDVADAVLLAGAQGKYMATVSHMDKSLVYPTSEVLTQWMKRQLYPSAVYVAQVATKCTGFNSRRRVMEIRDEVACAGVPGSAQRAANLRSEIGQELTVETAKGEPNPSLWVDNSLCDMAKGYVLAHTSTWRKAVQNDEGRNVRDLAQAWLVALSSLSSVSLRPSHTFVVAEDLWDDDDAETSEEKPKLATLLPQQFRVCSGARFFQDAFERD